MRSLIILMICACGPAGATIEPGSYDLVGARATLEQSMEPWAGPPVTLQVSTSGARLFGGTELTFSVNRWPKADWVDGCWTMQGTTEQEVWTLECDAPITLEGGLAAPCPVALIAACPDGRDLMIRELPERNGSTTGCGESGLCVQFAAP